MSIHVLYFLVTFCYIGNSFVLLSESNVMPPWLSGRALVKKFSLFFLSGRTLVQIQVETNIFGHFDMTTQDKFGFRKPPLVLHKEHLL